MLIIYRKEDGLVVDNQGINNAAPDIPLIIEHVVSQFGGSLEDYGTIELDNIGDAETVNKTFTHEYSIQDGQVVFGDKIVPPEHEPRPPSEIEILQQENAMLQMSVMEMTMYAATQDERLQGQEQAILELSMIVAGGGS